MNRKSYPDDYFSANKLVLKIGGMWIPNKNKSFLKWLSFVGYNCFCVIFCNLLFCTTEIFKLTDTYTNIKRLMQHTGRMMTHMLANYKVFTFYWRRHEIFKLLKILEDSEFKYEEICEFIPGLHFQRAKTVSTRITIVFLAGGFLSPISNYAPVGFKYLLHYTKEEFASGNISCFDLFPYYSWIPFSTDTKASCGFGLVYQSFALFICASQIAGHDALFSSILVYLGAHLVVLREAFETMKARCLQRVELSQNCNHLHDEAASVLERQMKMEMRKCSRHLQTIIHISSSIEWIFNLVTLGQVLVALFALVSCLFMISTVPIFSATFVAQSVYLLMMMYQLGIYCWFGNEITLISKSLPQSLYQSDWLLASPDFKKSMIINMIRMQTPITLTVGKFSPLTLTTYVSIVKGSYSYFAVLQKMNK